MPEQKIKMVQPAQTTREAFGISMERKIEILRKLIAIAKIYPKYAIIAESFLNCTDKFTEMERLYGLFELGKVSGAAALMRQAKIAVQHNRATMPLEAELLSLMSKHVLIVDPVLASVLKIGKRF